MNTEEKKEFDKMLAAASQSVVKETNETLQQIPQIMEETIKYLQSLSPQPQDPQAEMAKADLQRKQAADQAKAQMDQAKMQSDAQSDQAKMQADQAKLALDQQLEQMRLQIETLKQDREDQRKQIEIAARMKMNADDNDTAKQLAALEVASGERIAVSTGTGINPNP
jgi:hypothetical protein